MFYAFLIQEVRETLCRESQDNERERPYFDLKLYQLLNFQTARMDQDLAFIFHDHQIFLALPLM